MPAIDRRSAHAVLGAASPPAEAVSGVALTALRLLVGLMWLWNVVWKVPPDSGENKKDGLYFWTRLGVDFRVFAPFRWLLEHLVLPNFTVFGWLTIVVESLLAVLLLTGTAVRLAALIGIGQSLAIGLTVAVAPHEWPWAYAMMIGIHLVLMLTASAQYAAVDGVRAAAAVSIYVQWGRDAVWLGATATTAAVFVCAAIVAVGTAQSLTTRSDSSTDSEGDEN
jgi:hypothetical protein